MDVEQAREQAIRMLVAVVLQPDVANHLGVSRRT